MANIAFAQLGVDKVVTNFIKNSPNQRLTHAYVPTPRIACIMSSYCTLATPSHDPTLFT